MGDLALTCLNSGCVLASKAAVADSLLDRTVGLLKRQSLPQEEALIFPKCNSVHTVGMRFAIDLIFVDATGSIVRLEADVKPGRLIFPVSKAWAVVEMASGAIARCRLALGERLGLSSGNEAPQALDNSFRDRLNLW